MLIIGRIVRSGRWWAAEVPLIGVYTQGKSRKDAEAMLADAVGEVIASPATITPIEGDEVTIGVDDSLTLAAYILKYQRETAGLSLAEVARLLGAKSRNAYASYEQGRTHPTIGKFEELLGVVAPDVALVVGRRPTRNARRRAVAHLAGPVEAHLVVGRIALAVGGAGAAAGRQALTVGAQLADLAVAGRLAAHGADGLRAGRGERHHEGAQREADGELQGHGHLDRWPPCRSPQRVLREGPSASSCRAG